MKKSIKVNNIIKLCLSFILFITPVLGKNTDKKKVILVTAKAVKSKVVKNKNYEKYKNAAAYPQPIMFTFKDVKVELGKTEKYKRSMKFVIETRTDYMILNADRVSLLIDVTDDHNHKLLEWDIPTSFVCFNKNLLDSEYEHQYFKLGFDKVDNEKCTILID